MTKNLVCNNIFNCTDETLCILSKFKLLFQFLKIVSIFHLRLYSSKISSKPNLSCSKFVMYIDHSNISKYSRDKFLFSLFALFLRLFAILVFIGSATNLTLVSGEAFRRTVISILRFFSTEIINLYAHKYFHLNI